MDKEKLTEEKQVPYNRFKKVNAKKKKSGSELEEIKGLLLRVQADFDNYRKRTQKEKEEFGAYLNTDLILRIIPVMDNFQLALKHLPQELSGSAWVQGIFHIEHQLEQILADEGVQKVVTVGQPFDPHTQEAIEEVPSDLPQHTVTEEVMAGYRLKDKIVRPAKVKVSNGLNKAETPKDIKEKLTGQDPEGEENE